MKRTLITILTIFTGTTIALANTYVDGMFILNNTGDAKIQSGFGLKIATSIRNDFNVVFRSTLSSTTEDPNTINEIEYIQVQGLLGGEYLYYIQQYPVAISLSAAVGVSHTEISPKNDAPGLKDLGETGIGYGLWLGTHWILTQWATPFIEIGYSKSMYTTDLKDASIGGFQFLVGVRFTVWGKNKTLSGDYE